MSTPTMASAPPHRFAARTALRPSPTRPDPVIAALAQLVRDRYDIEQGQLHNVVALRRLQSEGAPVNHAAPRAEGPTG